ncbi:hypothetical protein P7K49_030622, partial [Saguinus oedipus]
GGALWRPRAPIPAGFAGMGQDSRALARAKEKPRLSLERQLCSESWNTSTGELEEEARLPAGQLARGRGV